MCLQFSAEEPGIGEAENDDLVPGLAPSLPFVMDVDSIQLAYTETDESVAATLDATSDPRSAPLTSTTTPRPAHPSSLLDEELPEDLASRFDESWRLIQPMRRHRIFQSAAPIDHDDPPVVTDTSGAPSIISSFSDSLFDALSQLSTTESSLSHGNRSGTASSNCRSPGSENRHPAASTWSDSSSCYEDAVQYQTDHIAPLEFFEFPDQSSSWQGDAYLRTWLDAQLSVSESVGLLVKVAESLPSPPQVQGTALESSSEADVRADIFGKKLPYAENTNPPANATVSSEKDKGPVGEGKIPEIKSPTEEENVISTTKVDESSGKGEPISKGEADSTLGKELLPANRDVVVSKDSRIPVAILECVEDGKSLKEEAKLPESMAQLPQPRDENKKNTAKAKQHPKDPIHAAKSETENKSAVSLIQPPPSLKHASTPKKGTACQQASQSGNPEPAQTAKAGNNPSPTQAPGPGEKPPVAKNKATTAQKTTAQPGKPSVPKTQPAQKGKEGGTKSKKGVPQQTVPPKNGTTCPPPPATGKKAAAQKPGSKPATVGPTPAPNPNPQTTPPPPPSAPPPKAPPSPKPNQVLPPPENIPQFTGKVIIEPHKQAFLYATLASSARPATPFGSHHLTLWSDASWSHDTSSPKAGMGVAHRLRPADPWTEAAYTISSSRRGRQSFCEILAIEAALGIAKTTVQRSRGEAITRVTVFSDAQPALDAIAKPRRTRADHFARGAAYSAALGAMGAAVELRWVPGHCGVEGNAKADAVAGLARLYGPDPSRCGVPPEDPSRGRVPPEEPTVMKLSVAVLRGFAGVLGTMRGMVGAAGVEVQREEEKIAGWLARAAREEGCHFSGDSWTRKLGK
ncbi:hypothetical protein B0T18DRAFT_392163 [Schizothecium vesticola]|uniref:RNase H type-1 domain-containing protein n=1 Tax=Schizothecium vesticola TaxID=314040 RepID=A0AA40EQ18_9PEZI|nr:hypothetical protein B0T18DRAFT_392163 [Schizothecium vesticola]